MVRPLRIEYSGACYHVMNRGLNRKDIFRSDGDRVSFLETLGEVVEAYGLEVQAYALMGNHYHLLVLTPRGNLGKAMRQLDGVYTQRYNRRWGRDGPLFRGRYKAILVEADAYLSQVSRYIHLNPVESGWVKNPEDFPWSSYSAYLGKEKGAPWLRQDFVLATFGGGRSARVRYEEFVLGGVDEGTRKALEGKKKDPVFGTEKFREKMAEQAGGVEDREIVGARALRVKSLEEIAQGVASEWGVQAKDLYGGNRGRGQGRQGWPRGLAISLSRVPGGHSLKEIAAKFNVGSYATVSVTRRRYNERMKAEPFLLAQYLKVRKIIFGS